MHLRQPGFTYSGCRPFTKKKQRMQKFKETQDSRYVSQNGFFLQRFINLLIKKSPDTRANKFAG